ncbi:GPI-anchored protein LLG3-like [Mercurialis annua]|uniref:GPI-anchored protein LLG3-like n=1 Tax=Mercurialis annua TaxID=3986 RepID=UPI00215F598A|nr:GPI-anchored protein LLG3-like [Mercurialis annua]
MACNYNTLFYFIFFFLLIEFAISSSFISYDSLNAHEHLGRALLQAKKECNISFEGLDYSILTNNCKGPQYPVKPCCGALTQFACPYAETLNDRTNNCAETMFSYINLYGKYPPGLFANQCRGDKDGLACDDPKNKTSNAIQFGATQSLMLTAGFLGFFYFQLF